MLDELHSVQNQLFDASQATGDDDTIPFWRFLVAAGAVRVALYCINEDIDAGAIGLQVDLFNNRWQHLKKMMEG